MLSLTGQTHEEWKTLAQEEHIKWHDAEDSKPVIYLGYPLYSTESQLQHFLDTVELKITNHANMMKSRSLSVLGRSLIANALLLSKLWHILRVTITPNGWLPKIRRIIRGFIFPFAPHPSWSVACEPKSKLDSNMSANEVAIATTSRKWSEIVAKGQTMKVPTTSFRKNHDQQDRQATESIIIFERDDLAAQMKLHRAEMILQQALNPDTVLFEIPGSADLGNEGAIYKMIEKQLGLAIGFRTVSHPNKNRRK
ncbi:hypothetical protein [Absidia glauca]|uniref:Uncharacterized protein n=1 Tax=Absidia glauca TaxID=4829 RepID=A0A168NGZ6_ABSGL|nr:hypothetical protein [Absidia glauca]